VALVCKDGGVVYEEAHGTLATHPATPLRGEPVTRETVYDLASLTKVLSTGSLVALAVSEGTLDLDAPVPEPWCDACPGAQLRDLLEHCAGLPAHREYFTEVGPFDAPAVLDRVRCTAPEYPLRTRAVYSDLGFMVLGAWLERVYGAPLDTLFGDRIAFRLSLEDEPLPALEYRRLFSDALPGAAVERSIAPTEVYDPSLHPHGLPSHFEVRSQVAYAHGAVHDDNAYVMGGVAGHAGLFGTARGVLEVARGWLELLLPGLDRVVRDTFWQPSTVPGSTRRLGFDGPSPDGSGATGSALGHHAVGHTGYTGTSLWMDPERASIYILLSNRVHPVRDSDAIRTLRPRFHQAAARL
jgi:CubicO group peptidase (beta-lactamase class C family)